MGAPSRLDELTDRARRIIAGRAAAARPAESTAAAAGVPAPPPVRGAGPAPTAAAGDTRQGGPAAPAGEGAPAMIVLGVDPGTATTGYGIVRSGPDGRDGSVRLAAEAFGVVETPAGAPMPERLLAIHRELRALIAAHRPTHVAVEQLFFGRNATTAITVGQARGVALLAAAEAGLPVVEYTPLEVKHAIAGFGRADKHQMQRMVQALLGLPALPRPDDAADALAIAVCHARLARARALGLR